MQRLIPFALVFLAGCGQPADGPEAAENVRQPAPNLSAPAAADDAAGNAAAENGAAANAPAEPPAEDVAAIPAAFRGEWNGDLAACGSGRSESRLRIEADRVRFYESSGEVTGVRAEGERSVVVTARYTGEGDSWDRTDRLELSDDGRELRVGDAPVRYRCP